MRYEAKPQSILGAAAAYLVSCRGGVLFFYPEETRKNIVDVISTILEESGSGLSLHDGYQLFITVRNTAKIEGDLAEVGVYRGGSARIICEAKGHRPLHLFDTFKGIPKVDAIDQPNFSVGQYSASSEGVQAYLRDYPGVHFYRGVFPETAQPVASKDFSFVHLDVDTYETTLESLRFFWPRL